MSSNQKQQKERRSPRAIVIRGIDKSKLEEVRSIVPNYVNVTDYEGDIWVFTNFHIIFYRLKNKYQSNKVERVESNKDAHTKALRTQTQLNWDKFKKTEKNKDFYDKNGSAPVMMVIHSSPAVSSNEETTKDFVQRVAKHYVDNEKHKLRFSINRYKIDWFNKFQKDKSIKDANGKPIENLRWTLYRINQVIGRRQNIRIITVKLFIDYNRVEKVISDLKNDESPVIITFANPEFFKEQRQARREWRNKQQKSNKQKGVRSEKRENKDNRKSSQGSGKSNGKGNTIKINLRKFPSGTAEKLEPVIKSKIPPNATFITDVDSIVITLKDEKQYGTVRSSLKNIKVNGQNIM